MNPAQVTELPGLKYPEASGEGEATLEVESDWPMSTSDADLYKLGTLVESYSNMTDEALRSLLRSQEDILQTRKFNLRLLESLKDADDYELLKQQGEGDSRQLNHEIKLINAELDSRRSAKKNRPDDILYPTINDESTVQLDLQTLATLMGSSFTHENSVAFSHQYLAFCQYTKSTPLSLIHI